MKTQSALIKPADYPASKKRINRLNIQILLPFFLILCLFSACTQPRIIKTTGERISTGGASIQFPAMWNLFIARDYKGAWLYDSTGQWANIGIAFFAVQENDSMAIDRYIKSRINDYAGTFVKQDVYKGTAPQQYLRRKVIFTYFNQPMQKQVTAELFVHFNNNYISSCLIEHTAHSYTLLEEAYNAYKKTFQVSWQ